MRSLSRFKKNIRVQKKLPPVSHLPVSRLKVKLIFSTDRPAVTDIGQTGRFCREIKKVG